MANIRLYQFPNKVSPVPADEIYGGDSAASFDEVNMTIAQLISAYPNLSTYAGLTFSDNSYAYVNNSGSATVGTITALGVSLLADSTISAMQGTLGYQAAPVASLFAGWDANKNLSANSFISAYATTATAASTTTLTVSSKYQQFFTGTTTQTVLLPVTSTLVLGQQFYIVNNSTGAVTVQSSGANTIQAMAANTTLLVTCIAITGTGTASWYADYNFQTALALPLSLTNGGTNASLTASNGGIFYSTASAAAILAGTATANQVLLSGLSTAPTWSTATYPATTTINQLLYSSSANIIAGLATASAAVLTTVSGVPTWASTLSIALGGTNSSSVTVVAAASAWAGWDANSNMSANNFLPAYTTTATAASTTTLTVASTYAQFFTGTTTQSVVMPVTSTLYDGFPFYIVNNSTGAVTVKSSGGNTIQIMAAGTTAYMTCVNTGVTTAAGWNCEYAFNGGEGSGTVNSGNSGQLAYYGSTGTAVSGGGLGNIKGITSGSSISAGNIGEIIASQIVSASAVSCTRNTPTDITSLSLSAGLWSITGNVSLVAVNGSTSGIEGWISQTSATLPDKSSVAAIILGVACSAGTGVSVPSIIYNLSGPTTVYLSAEFLDGAANGTICGSIQAVRIG